MIRTKDKQEAEGTIKYMIGSQIISAITGIALNIKLKSFYPAILSQPRPLRWAYRTLLFLAPLGAAYLIAIEPSREKLKAQLKTMHKRLTNLGADGNV